MQSKITLQLTFNFGDQLNNDLIPKLLLKKLWMKPYVQYCIYSCASYR